MMLDMVLNKSSDKIITMIIALQKQKKKKDQIKSQGSTYYYKKLLIKIQRKPDFKLPPWKILAKEYYAVLV